MVKGSPGERNDWVLKGGLAQGLAPHLGLELQTDYQLILAGLMQITHKNHLLSSNAPLKSFAGTRIEPSCKKALSTSTLRILRK